VRKFNSGNIQYNHSIETHITTIPQYYTTSIPKPHSSVPYGITSPACQQNSAAYASVPYTKIIWLVTGSSPVTSLALCGLPLFSPVSLKVACGCVGLCGFIVLRQAQDRLWRVGACRMVLFRYPSTLRRSSGQAKLGQVVARMACAAWGCGVVWRGWLRGLGGARSCGAAWSTSAARQNLASQFRLRQSIC
jgi:hypothetical protein